VRVPRIERQAIRTPNSSRLANGWSVRLNRKLLIFTLFTLFGVVVDQAIKWWVRTSPDVNALGGIKVIPGFFSIVHAENPGAAFGMFGDLSESWRIAMFAVFTLIAVAVIVDMYRKLPANDWFLATTLGLILSGALGNLIDRLYKPFFGVPNHRGQLEYGATVTDFLRFYTDHPDWAAWLESMFGMSEYPSFNVADANLVVGVGMFIIHYLFIEGRGETEADGEETAPGPVAPESPDDPDTEPNHNAPSA
jgi:lipoprotein signal peptidase